jgi:hypothetical protein
VVLEDREPTRMDVRLYTDAYVVRGWISTYQRRLSDLLNAADPDFLVVEDVALEEFRTGDVIRQAPFAQINLNTVLFAVSEQAVESKPEFRIPKVREQALVIVPPFRITGHIHLPQAAELRHALMGLTGRFLPVTEVTYWSESLREPHTSADMLAVNHARAQIFAPYQEPNVWGDLNEDAVRVSSASLAADAPAEPEAEPASAGVWIGESEDGA